jgi:hypothetical protein
VSEGTALFKRRWVRWGLGAVLLAGLLGMAVWLFASRRTLLTYAAAVDEAVYPRGVRVSSAAMQALQIRYHDTCPQWNYTLSPRFDPTWN